MPEPAQTEIGSRYPENQPSSAADSPSSTAFEPLETCPQAQRSRYQRRAAAASEGRFRAAVELKCLECCAWSRPEAKRCHITGCPLWALNRRIFGGTDE